MLWDLAPQSNLFVAFDSKICTTYIFNRYSISGKYASKVGDSKLMSGQIPLLLYEGEIALCVDGGKFTTLTLSTHIVSPGLSDREVFDNYLKLKKYYDAWRICEIGEIEESKQMFKELGEQAIKDLDVKFAIRVYKKINDTSMVLALKEIEYVDDLNSLSGFCCLFLGKSEEAKEFFLQSNYPSEALEICRDLLQWEQAITLANKFHPDQVPFIAREFAQQLEFT